MGFVDTETRILVQGITGREAVSFVRAGLDYGARIVAGVTPGKGGQEVHGVPVFDSVRQAQAHVGQIDASIVSVPAPAALEAVIEAALAGIRLVVVTTERIPRKDVAQMVAYTRRYGSRLIGPNTLGLIAPEVTKIGSAGGPAEDARRAYQPGPVAILSRSGGMTTELANLLTLNTIGQSICIGIGGDPLVGSSFTDLYRELESDPDTRVVLIYTEPGGTMEQELVEHMRASGAKLPVVAFVAGQFMDDMQGVRFGHAGTIVQSEADTARAKQRMLSEAGCLIAQHISEIPALITQALGGRLEA